MNETQLQIVGKNPKINWYASNWAMLIPFLGGFTASLPRLLLNYLVRNELKQEKLQLALGDCASTLKAVDITNSYLIWHFAAYVVLVLTVIACIYAVVSTFRFPGEIDARFRFMVLLLSLVGGLLAFFDSILHSKSWSLISLRITEPLLSEISTIAQLPDLTNRSRIVEGAHYLMWWCVWGAVSLLLSNHRQVSLNCIADRLRVLRLLFYLYASALVAQVLSLIALDSFVATFASDRQAFESLAYIHGMLDGAHLTLLLLATYSPSLIILKLRASTQLVILPDADRKNWEKEHGVGNGSSDFAKRAVLVLSPLLASGASGLFEALMNFI